MSRVGKKPLDIPSGVKASFEGRTIHIEGPKGKLSYTPADGVAVDHTGSVMTVSIAGSDVQARSNFGTTRAILGNMVHGVTTGWKRNLELNGVGYTAKLQGQNLTLAVGFSHEVVIELPAAIRATVTKNTVELESADRQLVGLYASKIRDVQPPEPYLGKGIKYAEETIRRKAGKTGKK